jgi:hypothetical protein
VQLRIRTCQKGGSRGVVDWTVKHNRYWQRANVSRSGEVVETEPTTVTQEGAVSEKSTRNDVDYAAKSRMAQHRAVLRWLMQFWLANSLPSNTISAIQSWTKGDSRLMACMEYTLWG